MHVHQYRCGLKRTLGKLAEGSLTLGFIGGSITDGRTGHNWPEPVISWFVEQFPGVCISVENAAIGATGSELGVYRAQRDLIDRDCDIVFVEYAVNDAGCPRQRRRRTQEGLIRKLLAGEGRDLVLPYTFSDVMYEDLSKGRMPESVSDLEELAEHYGIGSVWMGLHALREVQAGRMRWEEWLPDGLHPQHRGSLSYAQSVIQYLERELVDSPSAGALPTGDEAPRPLDPLNWETATCLPFSEVKLEGPWSIRRWANVEWIDQVFDTAAVGARMAFSFEGRVLSLAFDFGKSAADFRYRLDGAAWQTVSLDRPEWCGPSGWFRITTIADDLPSGPHGLEIEVIRGPQPECTGTNFRLGLIGVVE